MSLNKESQKLKLINFGWAYLRKGSVRSSGLGQNKKHYFREGSTISLCGQKITDYVSDLVFVDKSQLLTTRICAVCEIRCCGCDCHRLNLLGHPQNCTVCLENHIVIKRVG